MSRTSHHVGTAILSFLLAASLTSVIAAKTSSSTVSSQDKAKACNDAADKKGLKGQERKTFTESCLNKAAESSSPSEQDKATTCNSLADKKGLKGPDRRSFVKDCMKKANP